MDAHQNYMLYFLRPLYPLICLVLFCCLTSCEQQQSNTMNFMKKQPLNILENELKQEELTLAYRKERYDNLSSLENTGAIAMRAVRDAKYEYELQILKVEQKRIEIKNATQDD